MQFYYNVFNTTDKIIIILIPTIITTPTLHPLSSVFPSEKLYPITKITAINITKITMTKGKNIH